jgi:hypothetical protein
MLAAAFSFTIPDLAIVAVVLVVIIVVAKRMMG